MPSLLKRYEDKIAGVLSCFDRVVVYGTLPDLCYAEGMTRYLRQRGVRIFDYPRWAEPLREVIRENAEKLAKDNGIEIEFVRKSKAVRKEDLVAQVIARRGDAPGLVHILSAMEECGTYKPWHDKKTGKTFLRPDRGKCLHYYFYFIDEALGLCYVRVPTWAPFRLQVYFNGHHWLAAKLRQRGIGYALRDNAFVALDDFSEAQRLADDFDVSKLHSALDRFAQRYCPVLKTLAERYHWSIMQVEYATDVVFRRQSDLEPIYDTLVRTAVHAVKPDQVATFLGRKLDDRYRDELGNDFSTRIEGTRIRHHMGPASIKMYDKFSLVLRIETTANDVSFFKHHRKVEQRDGTTTYKLAPVKKAIYSLAPDLRELLSAANRRYLEFISELDDPSAGIKALHTISKPSTDANGRSHRGFNLFLGNDQTLFETVLRGEFTVSGWRNKDLRRHLGLKPAQASYVLKRLRTHGLAKRVGRTYKYYLTSFGRHVAATGLKVKELFVVPALASRLPA